VCIYGDPNHRSTSVIWEHVLDFVVQNSNLPIFCMGDINELMNANEKLGPTRANVNRINEFCASVKQCGLLISDIVGLPIPGLTSAFPLFQLMNVLIDA